MSTEAIYQKYMEAVQQVTGAGNWIDFGVVRLALRLAVQDAYGAGSALADDLAAIVASQAQPERSPADQRYAEQLQAQISRLNEWLAKYAPALYHNPDIDTAAAVLMELGMLRRQISRQSDDTHEDLASARQELVTLIAERDGLRQQLAQLDADNADLTQRLANLAGVQDEAERLRQEIADLREQVIPDYQNSLASLSAEIDRLTRQNVIATDTFNSLHTNGNGAKPPADTWYEGLDAETNDWRISIEAGRRTWRQIPKPSRLLLFQALARHLGSNGAMPTQAMYEEHKPQWMPTATAIAFGFAGAWGELLAAKPSEVPA